MQTARTFYRIDDQLELTYPGTSDAADFYRMVEDNRRVLAQYFPWTDQFKSADDAARFIFDAERYNQGGQKLTLFIRYRENLVGSIAFVNVDRLNKTGELGFWLVESAQGRGIMSRCCERMLRHGFKLMRLNRIFLQTHIDNLPVHRLAERLRFKREGQLRQAMFLNDAFHDLLLFSILKEDYR